MQLYTFIVPHLPFKHMQKKIREIKVLLTFSSIIAYEQASNGFLYRSAQNLLIFFSAFKLMHKAFFKNTIAGNPELRQSCQTEMNSLGREGVH